MKKNDFAFFIATFFTKKEHLIYFLKSKRKYIIYDERFYKNLNFFIIKIIPKKKNLLVFGDRAGLRFADNSKHLFIYLNKYKKRFRCI